ncbi:unnamed protein product [Psylliodes chrysocephalus]|uniref:DNA-directed DNA polymerase n=1 Tax=Psylliodes chrysocephalus TaxID=3402493 RepID=A0A9P0GBN1_9CUCU|nr:unnamed protein product [Psylliodes chrysocephala]
MDPPNAIVDKVQTHLKDLKLHSAASIEFGLKLCNNAVRALNIHLKLAKSISEKQHITACHAKIKSFKASYQASRAIGFGDPQKTAKHNVKWDDSFSAFKNRVRTGVISNLQHIDPNLFLNDCVQLFCRRIKIALKKHESFKINTVFCGRFVIEKADEQIYEYKCFETPNSAVFRDTDLAKWFKTNVQQSIMGKLEDFQEQLSGWALESILNLQVNINKYNPLKGSSYIELPHQIKKKKACINIKNMDDACFAWAVTAALHPTSYGSHPDRVSSYPHYSSVLKLKGIQFPMTLNQIPNFSKQNNISVNVYTLRLCRNRYVTTPLRLAKEKKANHVNLLMIFNKYYDEYYNDWLENEDVGFDTHFVLIKNLSRLVSTQINEDGHKKYFCDRCFHCCYTAKGFEQHTMDCRKTIVCRHRMPKENDQVYFKHYKNKMKAPFMVYADLECVLRSTDDPKKYQKHVPCSIGYYLKCSYDDSLSFYRSYRGEDCMQWFTKELEQLAEDAETVFLCPYDMNITPEQEIKFQKATHCHICEKPFAQGDKKVRDHDHLIPENNYRGASHDTCNLGFIDSTTIPIVFHNLSGYDSHFIIKDIAVNWEGSVDVLPLTKEKYISFTKHVPENLIKFRFIDSFRFMNLGLEELASYLTEFPHMKMEFPELDDEHINLLRKKGVFPYDYLDSVNKFKQTTLPTHKEFYNKLCDENITEEQYTHAQNVWKKFNIKTLGDYSDLYLKTDILLLVEIFEQFRSSCHRTYGLDPAHYFTLPGYTWDCMLYKTNQKLDLLYDYDMQLFIEKGTRGGLSQVCGKRRAHANNKYLPNYNSTKPSKYLMYFDLNNQYGWAMSQYLPYGGFEWIHTNIDVTSIPDEGPEGYILEVDLKYPQHLHDLHKDLPFCPEKMAPQDAARTHVNDMIQGMKSHLSKEEKLLATLGDKKNYVIHYRYLKQALSRGLVLSKIHRVLKFNQSPWLKSYIDFNTELRKNAKNEFEKNLFKLMNNAVFGKTMENKRKHSRIVLVREYGGRYGAEARISSPLFKSATVFDENLIAVELHRSEVFFNKPTYVGMSILDLSKIVIYDFHYEYMLNNFQDCSIIYTDTDSLIYEIRDQDPYEMIKRDCYQYFDTSDYSENNIYGIPLVNKKIIGLMKDENKGAIMTDFIALRSKMYVLKLHKSPEDLRKERNRQQKSRCPDIERAMANFGVGKKIKGIKKSIVRNKITFEDYVECLEKWTEKRINQNLIRSDKHYVHSITQTKVALSPFDDKRYIIPGTYETLPWGHYLIRSTNDANYYLDHDDPMDEDPIF